MYVLPMWRVRVAEMGAYALIYQLVWLAKLVTKSLNKRVDKKCGMWFCVHHDTTSLTGIGKGSPDQFTYVCLEELMEFLTFDVQDNGYSDPIRTDCYPDWF